MLFDAFKAYQINIEYLTQLNFIPTVLSMKNLRSKAPKETFSNRMNRNYIISESISISDGPMLYFSRILGLAPAATNQTDNKISIKWSLRYNVWSYFVATFVGNCYKVIWFFI